MFDDLDEELDLITEQKDDDTSSDEEEEGGGRTERGLSISKVS